MPGRAVADKPSDTLVVVSGEGSWTGSSTLPHLHHLDLAAWGSPRAGRRAPQLRDIRFSRQATKENAAARRNWSIGPSGVHSSHRATRSHDGGAGQIAPRPAGG